MHWKNGLKTFFFGNTGKIFGILTAIVLIGTLFVNFIDIHEFLRPIVPELPASGPTLDIRGDYCNTLSFLSRPPQTICMLLPFGSIS